jgi:exopolysaccharide production protein ExoZ
MTVESPQMRIDSIQVLRGIAALMVVVFHTHRQIALMNYEGAPFVGLAAGVDIFFVISGFIMWVSTERNPKRTPLQFLRDRVVRIVPLYWAVTLGMATLALAAPALFQSTVLDFKHLAGSLLFLASPNPSTGHYEPFLVQGWTLNLEMFFYLLFATAIAGSQGNKRVRGALITLLIGCATLAAFLLPQAPGELRFYGAPIILEFLLGIAIGAVFVQRRYRESRLWLVGGAVGFALLAVGPLLPHGIPALICTAPGAALIVAAAAFAPPASPRMSWLGDISFSVYLTHGIVLSAFGQIWRRIGLSDIPAPVFILVATALCVVAGAVAYRWVERPLTRIAKLLLSRREPSAPPVHNLP